MTLAKNELSEVRSVSGIILYAKHTVVSHLRSNVGSCEAKWENISGGQSAHDVFIEGRVILNGSKRVRQGV